MKCPGCKRKDARKLIVGFRGSRKIEGCDACFSARFDPHVYTGRKLWSGDEVYGKQRNHEMNMQFEQNLVNEASRLGRRRNYGRVPQ